MENHFSQVEFGPDLTHRYPPIQEKAPWYRSRRFLIFFFSLLVSASISLAYVFSQPAVYLSYASLLTVAKTAIDQQSPQADIQHVAIQKQILLGPEILAETARRLQQMQGINSTLTVADIRQLLTVNAEADTNLVEMTAEGPDPEILPLLINTWIEAYLSASKKEVVRSTDSATLSLRDELDNLTENINAKRNELDQYRRKNNITSTGRDENEALARLKGLNDALNIATEEKVRAKARLDAIRKAINRGQAVIPKEDTRTLSLLEFRAQELREELEELDQRYTSEYKALIPRYKVIPEKLEELETKISRMRQGGQGIVLADAQQEYVAASQTVKDLSNQLQAHNKQAVEFTARFAEHEALQSDLEGLELLFRETQERLVKIEAKQAEKYPQVSVVQRAFLPRDLIRPDYLRDSLIAGVGSILFSLFCVWVADFLFRKETPNAAINLSGIHLYGHGEHHETLPQHNQQLLSQQQSYRLESPSYKEISSQEFDLLFKSSNEKGKQLITLLLSGLSVEEITTLQMDDIDLENETLTISSTLTRSIPLNSALKTLFTNNNCFLTGILAQHPTNEELAALLLCSVIDAGLSASEINAAAITRSYIIYLVKQGMRLSDLELIVGPIPPTELIAYSAFSPPGQRRPFKEINLQHPSLLLQIQR
jgi:polysaccharide biosynthesis transport protein